MAKWKESDYDGCTIVPDDPLITPCCYAHDKHYIEKTVSRRKADKQFLDCMLASGFNPALAYTYYATCRALGWMWWYT